MSKLSQNNTQIICANTDKSIWLNISPEELILRKKAFWFIPQDGITNNVATKRIEIPVSNTIDLSFCDNIFMEYFS